MGCLFGLWQARRIDKLYLANIVDENVEARFPATTRGSHPMNGTHGPCQRNSPTNDRTTEREIDDEDKPAIWMVTPECHGHKEHFSEELGLI
jgi:hypothetical protein